MKMTIKRVTLVATFLLLFASFIGSAFAAEGAKWVGAFYVNGKVGLKWQKISDVSEYIIYRQKDGGEFEELARVSKPQHFDTDISPGAQFGYKIIYIGTDGVEVESSIKKVTIPGSVGEFKPPTWSGAREERGKLLLRWDPVPGAIAYNVYRSEASGGEFEVVGNATSTRYADNQGLVQGTTYYHILTALNEEFEETDFSEETSIKFGISAEDFAAQQAEENKIELDEIKFKFLFEINNAGTTGDMNQPVDVFLNSAGEIYITDALNFQVHCFDNSGKYLFSFGDRTPSDEKETPPDGTFSYPFSIFVDNADIVYVTDIDNHDIQVFSRDGKYIKRIKVVVDEGQKPFKPNGIHVLDDGRIVCTDGANHRWLIIDQSGKILKSFGGNGSKPGEFVYPDELTVSKNGEVCIVDIINARVQVLDLDGNFIRSFGEPGQTVGTFGRPKGIYIAENNYIWVADGMGNSVQMFTMEGEVKSAITEFKDAGIKISAPRGMFLRDGKFYLINRLANNLVVFEIEK